MSLCYNVKELKKSKNQDCGVLSKNETSLFDQVNNLNVAKVLGVIFKSIAETFEIKTAPKTFVAFKLLTSSKRLVPFLPLYDTILVCNFFFQLINIVA